MNCATITECSQPATFASVAHENGAIESPHGHLKNRIKQAIYLRGSNDFQSLEEYRLLIEAAVAKLNQQCQQKFEQEKTHLQSLPKYRIPDYEILTACVSTRSTVEVRCILYRTHLTSFAEMK